MCKYKSIYRNKTKLTRRSFACLAQSRQVFTDVIIQVLYSQLYVLLLVRLSAFVKKFHILLDMLTVLNASSMHLKQLLFVLSFTLWFQCHLLGYFHLSLVVVGAWNGGAVKSRTLQSWIWASLRKVDYSLLRVVAWKSLLLSLQRRFSIKCIRLRELGNDRLIIVWAIRKGIKYLRI